MAEKIEFQCNPQCYPEAKDILCSRQFLVEEVINLPCNKPDIQQLIDVKIQPIIESYKLINSPIGKKIYLRGRLEQDILYVADEYCQPVHALNNISPFHTFIDLCKCTSDFALIHNQEPEIIVEFMESIRICRRVIRKTIILFIWYHRSAIIPPHPQPIHMIDRKLDCGQTPIKIINCITDCRDDHSPRTRKAKRKHRWDEE